MPYIYDGLLSRYNEDDLYDIFCGEQKKQWDEERERFEERARKAEEETK